MFKYYVVVYNRLDCELFRSEVLKGYDESNLLGEAVEQLENNSIDLKVGDWISIELAE
jgi:hypothetical protein